MSIWFTKNCGDAMLAEETLENIKALFEVIYGRNDISNETAVFIRHESEGRLHCEIHAYFSPGAAIVAGRVDADPCARPLLHGLSLLMGQSDSWHTLFPEYEN